jgi:hypothetical protein
LVVSLTVKVPVHRVSIVSREHGSGQIVPKSESVKSLSQTIQVVVLRQHRYKFNELILEDEYTALGGEENVASRLSQDRKAESGVVRPDELKINVLCSGL